MPNFFYNFCIKKPFTAGIITFLLLLILTQALVYQRYLIKKEHRKTAITNEITEVKERIKATISQNISAAKTLALIVEKYGVPNNFNDIAKSILESNKHIDVLRLTSQGVITHIYPLKGNEVVLGHNILQDPMRTREAYRAIQKKSFFYAGPLQLKQGGIALVGRLPIFIENTFKGFSIVIVRLNTFLNAARLNENGSFLYQLSKINPVTQQEEFFMPLRSEFSKSESINIDVPEGEWKLHVMLKDNNSNLNLLFLSLFGLLFSGIAGLFIKTLAAQPKKLQKLVKEKSEALKKAESVYKTTLDRVSDAIVGLDKNWTFTFMNLKAAEILQREPQDLIGKHMWSELPEAVDLPFYHAYHEAMREQKFMYLEEYYPPYERYFENYIYPAEDGITIYFKDVTEKKLVEQKILNANKENIDTFNRINDSVISLDKNWNYVFLNEAAKATHPYPINELIGQSIWDIHPQLKGTLFERKFYEARDTQKVTEFDSYYAPMEKWFHLKLYPSLDGVTIFYTDVTKTRKNEFEKLKLEAELNASNKNIRDLAAHLQIVEEAEKAQIAREIHDELGQQLTGLKLDAAWIAKKITTQDETLQHRINSMLSLVDTTIKSVRKITTALRPAILDDLGLIASIEWLSEDFEKRTEISVHFKSSVEDIAVEKKLALTIFRVYQEALTNIAKHSMATEVNALMDEDDGHIFLVIKDNGLGFDTKQPKNPNSWGLTGMRERANMFKGKFNIHSEKDKGTVITLKLPMLNPDLPI